MRLTVKSVAKILTKEHAVCPFCRDEAEICAYHNKDGLQIKIFCNSCGAKADFAEVLVEIEKKKEKKSNGEYCPNCGSWEVYYENPNTGNGKYNCDDCGWEGIYLTGFIQALLKRIVNAMSRR